MMTREELMREQDRQLDRQVERIMEKAAHCIKHHVPFVAGIGMGDEFFAFGPGGACPECFWEERRAKCQDVFHPKFDSGTS
jgi:hypothetical protein